MIDELQIWIVCGAAFIAVALLSSVVMSGFTRYANDRRQMTAIKKDPTGHAKTTTVNLAFGGGDWLLLPNTANRTRLRQKLARAGFIFPDSVEIFIVARAALLLALASIGVFGWIYFWTDAQLTYKLLACAGLCLAGYFGPEEFLKRRQAWLIESNRAVFPDFLDLMVVCSDGGLSLEASLNRISTDVSILSLHFAANLSLMMNEIHAGRTTTEALDGLANRLGLEEAKSFSALLKQSLELGSDISAAMRVYSDEMRKKRLARVEEKAQTLPVKLIFPVAVFIFPVYMGTILTPLFIRFTSIFSVLLGH